MTRDPLSPDDLVPPACRATVDLLQGVMDGDLPAAVLDADSHHIACAACRGRASAARFLAAALAEPTEPVAVPPNLADRILVAVRADRQSRSRRRVFVVAGGLAAAAAVVLAVWLGRPAEQPPEIAGRDPVPPVPAVAPEPRPIRIGEEFSKAGLALLDAPKSIAGTTSAAPDVIAKVTDSLTRAAPPVSVESPRTGIAEIPDMARAGLEPVTGTAQKAFARLLHDVGTVRISTNAKPKS